MSMSAIAETQNTDNITIPFPSTYQSGRHAFSSTASRSKRRYSLKSNTAKTNIVQTPSLRELFREGSLLNKVLHTLLIDRTTHKNIVWATDTYSALGSEFSPNLQMLPDNILPLIHKSMLLPRSQKERSVQKTRTKKNAEVATPAWVCCLMNNYCDDDYFGKENVFAVVDHKNHTWRTTTEKVTFPEAMPDQWDRVPWQLYVDNRRIEITCGEAPFLVSRYDAVTGDAIPLPQRAGIVDRKLRVVNENATDEAEWMKWVIRAYEASYGYEYQGDNLFFARVNLVQEFIDFYTDRWCHEPDVKDVRKIARIVSWNLWQMDGFTDRVPYGIPEDNFYQENLFEKEKKKKPEGPVYACIRDWRAGKTVTFRSTKEKR